VLRPAKVIVSRGASTELGAMLVGARARLLPLDRPTPQAQQAAADLFNWIVTLESKDDAALATLARYAVNKLQELGHSETDAVCEALAQYLKRLGINEIRVTIGTVFDGSFDPGKYERRRVPASAPSGTIVRVIQRGFLNPSGVPLQKAILAVAE
jgi:molecular chaperone GrpE (heat shock protein)